jgi:hypothetical protein
VHYRHTRFPADTTLTLSSDLVAHCRGPVIDGLDGLYILWKVSALAFVLCKVTVYRLFENFGLAKLEHSTTEFETRHKDPTWRCTVQPLTPGQCERAHMGTEGRRGQGSACERGR